MTQKTAAAIAAAASGAPRVVEMPALSFRAAVAAQTVNDEDRTVELVFTTEAPVMRYDWMSDKRYLEVLSLDPAHVRLGRLNTGAPLLDSHGSYSVSDILGACVHDTAVCVKKEGRVRVRFSRREDVEPVWQDVKDGIVSNVSIGYRVYKFEETEPSKGNALPIRKAIDWEPFEVSMVPIPADAGAKVRAEKVETHPCEIVSASTRSEEEIPVKDPNWSEFIAEQPAIVPAPAPAPAAEPNERDLGATQERERVQGILTACRAARLPQSFADGLIKDAKMTLVRAQSLVFEELSKRGMQDAGPGPIPSGGTSVEITGDDPLVHERAGIEEALLNRMAPDHFKLSDKGKKYRGMNMLRVAEVFLSARGVRTTHLTPMQLAGAALGLSERTGGMHTTSDFANLLADLPNKILQKAYEEAPQTFAPIVRRVSLSDFKPSRLLQLGEAPALLEVLEHGEFTSGTIGEAKETLQLKTYGRKFAITRQALINDDTDAFARVPLAFGRQARNLESDLVWAIITANALMGDGVALFSAATHGNLAAVAAAIAIGPLGIARSSMRQQKGVDTVTPLNVAPKYLLVPTALETVADQFVAVNLTPNTNATVNPFAGKLTVIAEPRLDANSVTAWYLAGDPNSVGVIVLATLDGESGPMVESRVGFDVDGLEIKVRHDVAAKAEDWRGLFKNAGV